MGEQSALESRSLHWTVGSIIGARFVWRYCIFVANTKKWGQLFLTAPCWSQLQLRTWECRRLNPWKHLSLLVSLLIRKSGYYLVVSHGIRVSCLLMFTEPFNAFSILHILLSLKVRSCVQKSLAFSPILRVMNPFPALPSFHVKVKWSR